MYEIIPVIPLQPHGGISSGDGIMGPNERYEGARQMIYINDSTMIHKPVGQVFDFMSTPENDFQWQYGTLESSRFAEGVGGTGTFFRSIGHLMGRRNLGTFEVTEFVSNKRYSFKSLSGPLQSRTSYTFEIANGSTKVSISTQAIVVNFSQVNEDALKKTMGKQLKENLVILKDVLEARRLLPRRQG